MLGLFIDFHGLETRATAQAPLGTAFTYQGQLVQALDSGRSLESGRAHLTLRFLPTAYGTVDSDG